VGDSATDQSLMITGAACYRVQLVHSVCPSHLQAMYCNVRRLLCIHITAIPKPS
jgi:hypothetical protein